MEIILSVNNREEVMTLPVTPPSFTIIADCKTQKQ